MVLKWKKKTVNGKTYRGKPGRVTPWIVQYKDKSGTWKDTANKSKTRSGRIKKIFD